MSPPVDQQHPTSQQLSAYSKGELPPLDEEQIEKHLGHCDPCCQTLHDLSDDTMVALLRQTDTKSVDDAAPSAAWQQATLAPGSESSENAKVHSPTAAASLPPELAEHARYEVLEVLGQGGMGSVYKAQHRMMNRLVALKVINPELVQNEAAVQRFHREVQAAARLTHPNIVTAFDAERAGNVHFLVMEYVDGIDLAEVVHRRGPLSVVEACDFIRQAALGLQHAHELGMVHRDIKPQNLMLGTVRNEEGSSDLSSHSKLRTPHSALIKILDFGLANFVSEVAAAQADSPAANEPAARIAPHLTQWGAMMGTPDYIAPEQARDAHSADIRSDIYSLGCTLHYLLSGQTPYRGDSVLDKILAHAQQEPAAMTHFRDDVPQPVQGLLSRMMAKSPADRIQTPREVAQALQPYAGQDAKRSSTRRRPPSTRGWVAAAAALLVLFVALGAVLEVATDRGRLVIQSAVDDLQVVVSEDGKEVATIDLKTGTQVRWLPTGQYEVKLVGDTSGVKLDKTGYQMTRLGQVVLTANWNAADAATVRAIQPTDKPITQDGLTPDDGGWKITADSPRTARLFEVHQPNLAAPGPFHYRAKVRSENVVGKAYLEMWVRFPGMGEFFSKGLDKTLSGTNGWAEYEIPFILAKGQHPDLVKLNVTIEGTGVVWIKDIELRGRPLPTADAAK